MKLLFFIFLASSVYSQDSVRAKVIKTAEKTLVYKANGYRLVSYNCGCNLKKGDIFFIDKKRFDSLFKEAKPIKKRSL